MSEIATTFEQASTVVPEEPCILKKDHHGGCLEPNSQRTWSTESSYSLSDLDDSFAPTEEEAEEDSSSSLDASVKETQEISSEDAKKSCKIRWGQVHIRLFQIIPGTHPDCLKGPPITIDWDPFQELNASIDNFEEERAPDRYYNDQLRMSWLDRRCKLKRSGFSEEELKHAAEQSHKIRRHRERTGRKLHNEGFEMAQESFLRKIRRGFGPKITLTTKY